MGDSFVVSGLQAKRAALAGEIEVMERRIGQAEADLLHLDAVLRLYGEIAPEFISAKAPRKRNQWFRPGECARLVMDVLRVAENNEATSAEITERVMARRGLDVRDERTRRLVQHSILNTLGRLDRFQKQQSCGTTPRWRLSAEIN